MSAEPALHHRARHGRHAEPPSSDEALWQAYWANAGTESRNALFMRYRNLVDQVVNRLPSAVRTHWEGEDLEGFATFGLLDAIERFDHDSLVGRFPGYALSRIRGAVFDELRRLDWLPRAARKRVIEYRTVADDLLGELGRHPEVTEIVKEMGLDQRAMRDLRRDLQSSQVSAVDFSAAAAPEEASGAAELLVADEPDVDAALLRAEQLTEARTALAGLAERHRTVAALRLLGGLNQEQIGAMLGISNSRVSQIESEAMRELRRRVTG